MKAMTAKQSEILEYIKTFIKQNGFSPSIRNIADAFEITVKGAYDHVDAIEKKGMISRFKNVARSITVKEVAR